MRKDDPRTIITPDAFQVAPHLLGTPTAAPWRRFLAMLADLAVIAVLAGVPAFLLALAVALVFLRIAFGRGKTEPLARWVKGSLGCIGALALLVTAGIIWLATTGGPTVRIPVEEPGEGRRSIELGLTDLRALGDLEALGDAESDSAARAAADRLVDRAAAKGLRPEEVRALLGETLEASRSDPTEQGVGRERARRALASALARMDAPQAAGEVHPDGEGAASAGEDTTSASELAAVWHERRAAGDSAAAETARRALARVVAAPELAKIPELQSRNRRLRHELEAREEALEAARRPPGLVSIVRSAAEDLGITIGWSGVYFTAFLVLWRGRTPGKRLVGIRVVRLDGAPIGWWASFERFGGYAASLLTGLLGFLEILWDRNRQALHDKIARTVVIREERRRPVPAPCERAGAPGAGRRGRGPSGATGARAAPPGQSGASGA